MSTKVSKSNAQHKDIDGGYGWIILFACFLISFIVDGCVYSIGIVLPSIKDHFRVTQDQVNLLTSLNTGFLFCSGPVVSFLSNKFSTRAVVMGGAIITSSVYVISAFSPSIYFMMVGFGFIGGISTGCIYIGSLIIVAQYFDKLKGLTTGITMSGSGFGAFAFAPIAVFLVDTYSWAQTMIFVGSILIQCCILGALLRTAPPYQIITEAVETISQKDDKSTENLEENNDKKSSNSREKQNEQMKLVTKQESENNENTKLKETSEVLAVQSFHGSLASMKIKGEKDSNKKKSHTLLLFKNIPYILITISNFFVFFGYFLPFIYIPIRAKEINLDNYGWILSIIGIVNIPARLAFGILADKRYLSPVNLNTLSGLIATVPLWLFPFLNDFVTQSTFAVFFAIGIAGMNCLCTPYLADLVGKEKEIFSNAMGVLSLFRGIACFLGPFVAGFLTERFSTLFAFHLSAVCFTIGFVFSIFASISSKYKSSKEKESPENEKNKKLKAYV